MRSYLERGQDDHGSIIDGYQSHINSHGLAWPDSPALAFRMSGRAKSHDGADILAWLSPAYLGLAWPGSQPQAGPSTPLVGKAESPSLRLRR
jgi:hypothetical protein